LQAIAIVCGIAANWLCIAITADGVRDIHSRTGQLATIHMILLCLGSRTSILTSHTYLSSYGQQIAHSWLGWITIGNGAVHSIIVLGIGRRLELDGVGISGLVVSRQYPSLARRESKRIGRRRDAYDGTTVPITFVRANIRDYRPLYLGIAVGLLAVGYLSRFGHIWYRSCGTGPNARRLCVRPLVDAIQVSIVVPRPWHFRAGQHIYLRGFGMGIRAFWQSHPFTIAWWEGDRISMLIRPRGGFTRRLLLYAGCTLHALVEGPFGIEHDLGSYGTVLMFASGVGIAAQVPYIRRLLEGRSMSKARTQRIVIYWRLDNEAHQEWVKEWMDELLRLDVKYVLGIYIYVAGNYIDPRTHPASAEHFGEHDRVNRVFGDLDIKYTLGAELDRRRGNTVVAVCAGHPMIDEVRSTVRGALQQDIWLVELGVWPGPSGDSISPRLGPRDSP
ncbi:hypothetical protein C7212DRAFT_181745, partial [Tuber magnatum]